MHRAGRQFVIRKDACQWPGVDLIGDQWKEILAAAESTGGVEFYLMEPEGSRYSELETAQRCLASWRDLRGKA